MENMKNNYPLINSDVLVKIHHINKYYKSGDETIHALKNVSMDLPKTGLVFITGPSGCGKSTLLNLLGGLDMPNDGKIYIEGADFTKFSKKQLNSYLNSYMGFVFQEYNILKDLNLYDNIALSLEIENVPRKEIKRRTNEIIEKVGLKELKKRKINQLSGGQRQRIAVARALVKNPKMIIADEPTGNLDSVTGSQIFDLLKELSQDILVVVVTHDIESAQIYGDRIISIDDGMIVSDISKPFDNPTINTYDDSFNPDNYVANTVEVTKLNKESDSSSLKLIKTKAPITTSLKLSLKNINHKKFRFILMMFICAFSLAFLSFVVELNGDKIRQNVYTSITNDYVYADILDKVEFPDDYVKSSIYDDYIGTQLSAGSYNDVKEAVPNLNIHEYMSTSIEISDKFRLINSFYTGYIEYLAKYSPSNTYKLLAGRTPKENKNEVMITDYVVAMFKNFAIFDINLEYNEIIGKTIKLASDTDYMIVGIVDTNYELYTSFITQSVIDDTNKLYYSYLNEYKMMNTVYLNETDYLTEINVVLPTLNLSRSTIEASVTSTYRHNNEITTDIKSYTLTTKNVDIKTLPIDEENNYVVGRQVDHDAYEMVVPYSLLKNMYNLQSGEPSDYYDYMVAWEWRTNNWYDESKTKVVTLNIVNNNQTHSIDIKVVGVTEENSRIVQVSQKVIEFVYANGPKNNASLLAEMSMVPETAYKQFKAAYKNGYIIDLFKYKDDIESYEVSPFINLLSKAGLFIFAVFTIGILWTIVTIDIVDSKKEIGTLRSIGISGGKVSLIYIFQTAIICTLAYILSLILANIAINIYSNTIYDSLNLIKMPMYMLTYRSPLILLGFLIIITFVALAYPLFRIMSQKIIDVINEREDIL